MRDQAIYWFRNNLRLRDNPSLFRATREAEEILPVCIINAQLFETNKLGFENCGKFRWNFLMESIQALKNDLQAIGSDLLILKGDPVKELSKLMKLCGISTIYTSKEVDYNEVLQEKDLAQKLDLVTEYDQLLVEINSLPFNIQQLPFVFTDFRKLVEKNLKVRKELASVCQIKTLAFDFSNSIEFHTRSVTYDHRSACPLHGGEINAWSRLNYYFWETSNLASYKNTRNGLIGTNYSSKFSPFLAIGSISPVSIYYEIKRFEDQRVKNISTYWLIFELLWREFFKLVSLKHGKNIFRKSGIRDLNRSYSKDIALFTAWMDGKTGNHFVDSNMLELENTGFMSNRGRQNVASFLVHDLNIDWRWGAAYFESQLMDYDCSSNWCNWMYVAGVGNDPRSRKFNTKMQADTYDSRGKYQTLWLNPSLF